MLIKKKAVKTTSNFNTHEALKGTKVFDLKLTIKMGFSLLASFGIIFSQYNIICINKKEIYIYIYIPMVEGKQSITWFKLKKPNSRKVELILMNQFLGYCEGHKEILRCNILCWVDLRRTAEEALHLFDKLLMEKGIINI